MSGDHWIWSTLGIDPTDDITTIRRAYAHRLKQLDVDADPDAYAQLRHARDLAIEGASAAPISPDAPIPTSGVPAADLAPSDSVIEAASAGDAVADFDSMNEHHRLFVAVLFPDGERSEAPLTSEEVEALEHHFSALIADPRLHDISWFAGASEWFAETLARAFPRSQSLLVPAARFFDWPAQDELRRSPAINWLLGRIEGDVFAMEVQSADHPLNDAWIELTTPADAKSKRGRVVKIEDVGQLLSIVRTRYPHLEDRFDWYRVQLWETPISTAWPVRAIVMIIVVVLFNLARCVEVSRPSLPPSNIPLPLTVQDSQLENAWTDVGRLLRDSLHGHVTAAELRDRDPQLVAQLIDDWKIAKDNGSTLQDYLVVGRSILLTRIRQNLTKASLETLTEYFETLLAQGELIASADQGKCSDFFRGVDTGFEWPLNVADRRQALYQRILLEAPLPQVAVDEPPKPSFRIPATLVKQIPAAIGISEQQFAAALADKGGKVVRCRAQLGLLRATVNLPDRERFRLMRAMVGGKAN